MVNKVFGAILTILILSGCASVQDIPAGNRWMPNETNVQKLYADGRALFAEQPRTMARVRLAAQMLTDASLGLRYSAHNGDRLLESFMAPAAATAAVEAAEAWVFVADNETNGTVRITAAKAGITAARQARELQPDSVAGHYWYAIAVGLLADADRSYGLKAVGEMEPALRRAIELDEQYEYAGPVRVLGLLLLRAPAPPISIGSSRKGLRLLQRAAELFPDYPENLLYLAEAFRDNKRNVEARELLNKIINAPPWPNRQFESVGWKTAAQVLLRCVPAT